MPGISDLGARALRWLPPETAHGVAVGLLRWGLAPPARSTPPPSLHVKLWGLEFPSPLGLASGFDKNAAALRGLYRLGLDLGLDAADFGECVDSGRFRDDVGQDQREGSTFGVRGTPAFFVNGRFLSGNQPFAAFAKIIDEELEQKGIAIN